MRSLLAILVPGMLACAAIGCATGSDTADADAGFGAVTGDASAGGQDTGARDPADSAAPDPGHADAAMVADSGHTDSGQTPADSGSGAGQDSGGALSCASSDLCSASSTLLGTIAGDESGPTLTQTGQTSSWLRLDMQEKDNSIIGHAMTFTATLASPAGDNFDLYAYLGSAIGSIDCTNPKGQSTLGPGQVDTVSFSWGETTGGLANGADDSASVMIEIRWVAGVCSSTSSWTLSAHGN